MRYGFTTGSCAAAAAKAAAYMLLSGKWKEQIEIMTPKQIPFLAKIENIQRSEKEVSCAVRKDGGDDPDVTTGLMITATVRFLPKEAGEKAKKAEKPNIFIDGGKGVGRVTKPGLDQPVGNAAINSVPRKMIMEEVLKVCALLDFHGNLCVEISVPGGEETAQKTFNPRLGILGGISILGTSGIVEPMSAQALKDTIKVELRQKKAQKYKIIAVSPGNYGLDFMKRTYQYDLDRSVKCSNFIGDTIDYARELEFEAMLLTGHIGKLVKVAGGIMNTHSKEGDCRMELIVAASVKAGVDQEVLLEILSCVTTEEAMKKIEACGKLQQVMDILMEKILFFLNKRAEGKIRIEVIVYSNELGELGHSAGAKQLLEELKTQNQE